MLNRRVPRLFCANFRCTEVTVQIEKEICDLKMPQYFDVEPQQKDAERMIKKEASTPYNEGKRLMKHKERAR